MGVYLFLLVTEPFILKTITGNFLSSTTSSSSAGSGGGTGGGNNTGGETNNTVPDSDSDGEVVSPETVSWVGRAKTDTTRAFYSVYKPAFLHAPFYSGFQIGLRWRGNDYSASNMVFEFFYSTKLANGTISSVLLESEACTASHFPSSLAAELSTYNLSMFRCPKSKDIGIQGAIHSKEFNILMVTVRKCNATCTSANFHSGFIDFIYVNGVYDHSNPTAPVKYILNTETQIQMDQAATQYVSLKMKPNLVEKADSSLEMFYTLRKSDESYHYGSSTYKVLLQILEDNRSELYKVGAVPEYQPDISVPDSRRVLSASEKSEEKDMSSIYMFFYTISQLGGFYAFFIVTIGILLRPVVDKLFQHEAVNSLHLANKVEFNKLKEELSDQFSQGSMLGQEGMTTNKQAQTKSEVLSKDNQKLFAKVDSIQTDNKLKKGVTMKHSTQQSLTKSLPKSSQKKGNQQSVSNNETEMQDGRSNELFRKKDVTKNKFLKIRELNIVSPDNNRFYSIGDLLYNIFCCLKCRSKDKASAYNRYKYFCNDAAKFEQERDLVNMVSKMSTMQSRISNLEDEISKMGVSETVEPSTAQLVESSNSVDKPSKIVAINNDLVQENSEEEKDQSFKTFSKDFESMKEEIVKAGPVAKKEDEDWNPQPIDFKTQMDILSKARKK